MSTEVPDVTTLPKKKFNFNKTIAIRVTVAALAVAVIAIVVVVVKSDDPFVEELVETVTTPEA